MSSSSVTNSGAFINNEVQDVFLVCRHGFSCGQHLCEQASGVADLCWGQLRGLDGMACITTKTNSGSLDKCVA